jgi:hypothetical protein
LPCGDVDERMEWTSSEYSSGVSGRVAGEYAAVYAASIDS